MYYPIGVGITAIESFEPWAHRIINTYKREHPEVTFGQCGLNDGIKTADVVLNLHVPIDGKMVIVKVTYIITKSKGIEPHNISGPIYDPPVSNIHATWSSNGVDIMPYIVMNKVGKPVSVMSVPFDRSTLHRPSKKREVAAIDDDDE
jgi:hypothetical protein